MKKYLSYIGAFYLGFSVSFFAGLEIANWKIWVIMIPVLTLFVLDKNLNDGNT